MRPGLVARAAVLERVAAAEPWSVLSVVAPAGYGKSTILQQLADRQDALAAWVTLDTEDNDVTVLLASLATALEEIVDVDPDVFFRLDTEFPSFGPITRMVVDALAGAAGPILLVVDDLHALSNPACLDVVDLLVRQATSTAQIAVGSRQDVGRSIPRLRAEGLLVELGPADLAMDPGEATELAAGTGLELTDDVAAKLVAVTEGWPVALYLATRSMRQRSPADPTAVAPGHDRSVVEYVEAELLSSLDAEAVQFLTRSSVLEQMSGTSCDAVLRTFGSGDRLRALANSNLLVVPLDEERTWFRHHQLFRDLLRAELQYREPDLVPELARRASQWHEANGMLDDAVEYAMVARDGELAAGIVGDRAPVLYRTGRITTMQRWFDWLDGHDIMDDHPTIAVAGGVASALLGQAGAAERRAAAATRARPRERLADGGGDHVDGLVAMLRALLCREGVDRAIEDAEHAERLIPAGHAWRGTALTVLGLVRMAAGAGTDADRAFADAVDVARDLDARAALSVSLAERAVLALDRGEPRRAHELAAEALDVVDRHGLDEHTTSGIVFAVAARLAGRGGDADRTRRLWARAQRLRPHLNHAIPCLAVQTRLELVRSALMLSDTAGARTLLREVDEILRLRPGLGVLQDDFHGLRIRLDDLPVGLAGSSSLTTAELRLLPLLQTHLTFREIGARLYVSPNTVKTQAIAIYRKLGVSSRSDAVTRSMEVGLLER